MIVKYIYIYTIKNRIKINIRKEKRNRLKKFLHLSLKILSLFIFHFIALSFYKLRDGHYFFGLLALRLCSLLLPFVYWLINNLTPEISIDICLFLSNTFITSFKLSFNVMFLEVSVIINNNNVIRTKKKLRFKILYRNLSIMTIFQSFSLLCHIIPLEEKCCYTFL